MDLLHKLRRLLSTLGQNYNKRILIAKHDPLKLWHSIITASTTTKSKDIHPNTPNGKEEIKKKNGSQNGIKKPKAKDKNNAKNPFDYEVY